MMHRAYYLGRNDAIDKVAAAIPQFLGTRTFQLLSMNIAMTDRHSITPTPELVHQWHKEACKDPYHGGTFFQSKTLKHIAARAAQWGADQANHDIERKLQEARDEELEACCEVVSHWCGDWINGINLPIMLRTARRPKPPSLKGQALKVLGTPTKAGEARVIEHSDHELILRALEQLPDD